MGFLICEITVTGKSAYFGVPELGVDALKAGARRDVGLVGAFGGVGEAGAASARRPAVPARHRGQVGRLYRGARRSPHQPDPEADPRARPRRGEGSRSKPQCARRRSRPKFASPSTIPPAAIIRSAARRWKRRKQRRSCGSSPRPCAACVRIAARSKARPIGRRRRSFPPSSAFPPVYCAPGDIRNCHTLEERVELREYFDGVVAFAAFLAALAEE